MRRAQKQHTGRPPRFHVSLAPRRRNASLNRTAWSEVLDGRRFDLATRMYDFLADQARGNGRATFDQLQGAVGFTRHEQVLSLLDSMAKLRWISWRDEDSKTCIDVLSIPLPPQDFRGFQAFPPDKRLFFPEDVEAICRAWEEMYAEFRPTLDGVYQLTKSGRSTLAKLFRDVLDRNRVLLAMETFLSGTITMPDGSRVPLGLNAWPKYQRYGPTPLTFATYYDTVVSRTLEEVGAWAKRNGEEIPVRYWLTDAEEGMKSLRHSRRAALKKGSELLRLP